MTRRVQRRRLQQASWGWWKAIGGNGAFVLTAGENTNAAGDVVLKYRVLMPGGAEVTTLRGTASGTAVVEAYY